MDDDLGARLRAHVREIPDHPQPGVLFRDITPLLADGPSLAAAVDGLAELASPAQPDVVVGVEARGFILGAPLAVRLGTGFVPLRKTGKLPHETLSESYDLEYGDAALEIHADALLPGQRVVVVDDVLATGGTAAAAVSLVRRCAAEPAAAVFLLEIVALEGRRLLPGVPVHSLLPF